jgi:hypothetical protein
MSQLKQAQRSPADEGDLSTNGKPSQKIGPGPTRNTHKVPSISIHVVPC